MPNFNEGKELVPIKDLVCVFESEKAFGVLTKEKILNELDPSQVTDFGQVKDRFDGKLDWIPKSQAKECKFVPDNTFPNLVIKFKSKYNEHLIPYKTGLELQLPKWLAEEKGYVAGKKSNEPEPNDSSGGW